MNLTTPPHQEDGTGPARAVVVKTPRTWKVGLAMLGPISYAFMFAGYSTLPAGEGPGTWLELLLVAAKLIMLGTFAVLVFWAGHAIACAPYRWIVAGSLWSLIGAISVASIGVAHGWIEELPRKSAFRRWQAEPDAFVENLQYRHFIGWDLWHRVPDVLEREMIFLFVVAWVTAGAIRISNRLKVTPVIAAFGVPLGLTVLYHTTHPWSLTHDYDFFLGDAVVGGATGEFVFLLLPFDVVGAVVIAAAGVAMGGMILAWPSRSAHSP